MELFCVGNIWVIPLINNLMMTLLVIIKNCSILKIIGNRNIEIQLKALIKLFFDYKQKNN